MRSESRNPGDWSTRHLLLLLCLANAAGLTSKPVAACQGQPAQTVDMLCVDADDKPVAGAEIHLFQFDHDADRYKTFGPFKSDDEGKATCPEPLIQKESGNFDRWIHARVPGKFVGATRCAKWTNRKPINPQGKVTLYPSTSVAGEVRVPPGFDVTSVTVKVRTMEIRYGPKLFDHHSFTREDHFPGLDTSLPNLFERHPDVQGKIQFDDVPFRGRMLLVTSAKGLAEAQWRNERETIDVPIDLTLSEECGLSGRAQIPDGKPAVGIEVAARISDSSRVYYHSTFTTFTGANGEFVIHGLPSKDVVLTASDPKGKWMMRPIEDVHIAPGEGTKIQINMEPGAMISGRVLDPDGKPVKGAAISAVSDTDPGSGLGGDMTDADGRYRFRIPSGGARLYFNALPDGFAYPNPQIVKTLDVARGQADIENMDFVLERKAEGGK